MLDFFLDNIIIFLIVGGGIAQWVKSNLAAKKEREEGASHEVFDESDSEDWENLREFEEYQRRQEAESQAPPQREMATPPPLRATQVDEPEIFIAAPQAELERQDAIKAKLAEIRRQKSATKIEFGKPKKKSKPELSGLVGGGLRARLRSTRELKQALVMKEILDKPVGLRQG